MTRIVKRLVLSFLVTAAAATLFEPRPATAQDPQALLASLEEVAVIDQKVMIPMRDGIRLATDVYRPKTGGPVPIVFSRTPYNFSSWRDGELTARTLGSALEWVRRGYAFVVQNERGRFFSEGEWDILGPPTTDGYDALTWMADQPWSNGKVGTIGCSSTAEWQMGLAAQDHPAHAAMVPQGFGAGVGRVGGFYEQGNWYKGGAQQMLFTAWLYGNQNNQRPMFPPEMSQEDMVRVGRYFDLAPEMPRVDWDKALRHLPLVDIMKNVDGPEGIYEDMIKRTPDDAAWYEGGLWHDDMGFGVPGLWFMSWYDVSVSPNLELFNIVRRTAEDPEVRENQYAMVAPVTHCGYMRTTNPTVVGERNVGDARYDYDDLVHRWFDHWLKGEENGVLESTPHVQYYTMGANRWQSSDAWPPADAEVVTWYLGGDGPANSLFGHGLLTTDRPRGEGATDSFTYDPMNPVPSHGGNVCCTGNAVQAGAWDQRAMEARQDILVYSTEPLREGVEVTGPIEITLYVSSDARDTDFTVKLVDVYPDGRAYNLDETLQRVRYREGYDRQVFMEEGEVYELEVSPLTTSNYFAPGHRIRIEVSSSNFPRFTRNMNTGGKNWDETEGVVARNTVHRSGEHPSQIRMTVRRR